MKYTAQQKSDWLKRLLDNDKSPTQYKEMGIFLLGKIFFPDVFYNEFSPLHYQIIQLIFSLYDPIRERRIDKQAAVEAHREAAKTAIDSFLFPLYAIYNKGLQPHVRIMNAGWEGADVHISKTITLDNFSEDYIVIASETASSSEGYVSNIRSVLATRGDLAELYGEKDPRLLFADDDRIDGQTWRKNTFITADNTVVRGVGTGQQIRGRIEGKLMSRPTLLIVDDMYSEENVKSETSRTNLSKWFNNAALNSLDSVKGKCIWLGTLVHPDTVVKEFEKKNSGWLLLKKPIISKDELLRVIDECTINGIFTIPDKETCADIQKSLKTLSWPDRHDLRYILRQYNNYKNRDQSDWFFQEYMNEYQDPQTKLLKEESFYFTEIKHSYEGNQVKVEFMFNNVKWIGNVVFHIGLDPASSSKASSDDTAIAICGYARCYPRKEGIDFLSQEREIPGGRIFPIIMHIEGGKYAIHEYAINESRKLPGMSESIYNLCYLYELIRNPQCAVKVELAAGQEQILREIELYKKDKKLPTTIYGIQSDNRYTKAERILSIILPIAQKYKYIICNEKYQKLIMKAYYQLILLGMEDHNDYIDSIALGFKDVPMPYWFNGYADNNPNEDDEDTFTVSNNRYDDIAKIVGDENAWLLL